MPRDPLEFSPVRLEKGIKLKKPDATDIDELQNNGALVLPEVIDCGRLLLQTQQKDITERRQPVGFLELIKPNAQPFVIGIAAMYFYQKLRLNVEKDRLGIESNGWTAQMKGKVVENMTSKGVPILLLYTPWMSLAEVKTAPSENTHGISKSVKAGDLAIVSLQHKVSRRAMRFLTNGPTAQPNAPQKGSRNGAIFTTELHPKRVLPKQETLG